MKPRLMCAVLLVVALMGGFLGAFVYAQVADWGTHQPGSYYYDDVAVDSPHSDDIGYLREAGITRGLTDTTYGPTLDVNRQQMASYEARDFAAGVAFATVLLPYYNALLGNPGLDWEIPPAADAAKLMRWEAELLEAQAKSRPIEAVGGPEMYGTLAQNLRNAAQMLDPQ